MAKALKSAVARVLTLSLLVAAWPAWAQTARVITLSGSGQPVAPLVGAASPAGAGAPAALTSQAGLGLGPAAAAPAAASYGVSAAAASAAGASKGPAASPPARSAGTSGDGRVAAGPLASAAAPLAAPVAGSGDVEAFAREEAVRGRTVVLVGTKSSKPFILEEAVRVAKALGLNLFLVDDPEARKNSKALVDDAHFIPAPVNDRARENVARVAEAVAAHPAASRADAVYSLLSSHAKVTAAITDRLGAAGIPGSAVAAADDKTATRKMLNAVPELAVPFKELKSPEDARMAFREMGGGRVVLKSVRGENSRFLALGIDSEDAAEKAYRDLDAGLKAYAERPEARQTTFSQHPGIFMEKMLEKAPGSEETSVEVVMQHGKPAFAMVSDTKSIGRRLELAAGSITFPSVQPEAAQKAMAEAAGKALEVLGIRDGNARIDMILTKEGPRVVEINPFMGGANIFGAIKSITGMSLVEQGLRALLSLKVDPGHAPDGVVDYRFAAARHPGTFERAEGLEAARSSPGVVDVKLLVENGDTMVPAEGQAYEEVAEIIGKGATLDEAMERNASALRKLKLFTRKADGSLAEHAGDYLQPVRPDAPAPDPDALAPAKAPGLWSKIVLGFFSTFVLVQTVVESTSLAVSQMTEPLTQGFMALSVLVSSSYIAYSLGSFIGGRWVDRFGINVSYRTVLFTRFLIWTAIALLFNPATGTVALPALVALFSLDYFVHSIGRVAEHKLQVAWFQDSPTNSSRFGSFRDFIEYGTVFVASLMGLLVAAYDTFAVVIYPAPAAFLVAAVVSAFLRLPKSSPDRTKAVNWSAGFKGVFGNNGILAPLSGYIAINSFLYLLYYIIATAFGAYVTGDPRQASAVSGSLTGVYGVGALLGAAAMELINRRIEKRVAALPKAQQDEAGRRLYEASTAKSLLWAAAGVLGTWFFVSQTVLQQTPVWPVFAVTIPLFVIGFTAQKALIHLDTLMKDRIPKADKELAGSILGAIRTLTYLSFVLAFLMWGGIFAAVGAQAFWYFGAFYTLAAGFYVWLARHIGRQAK